MPIRGIQSQLGRSRRKRHRAEAVGLSTHARLHELLGALGNGLIDVARFRRLLVQYALTDDDIDDYCCVEAVWIPPSDNEER
jgi:hypothetical protein